MCDSEQTIYLFVWREPYKPRLSTVTVFWQDPTHVLLYQRGGLVLLFLNGPESRLSKSRHPFFFCNIPTWRKTFGRTTFHRCFTFGKKTATMYNLIWGGYPLQRDKKQRQLLHEACKMFFSCNLKLPLEDSKMFENMFRNPTSQNATIQCFSYST